MKEHVASACVTEVLREVSTSDELKSRTIELKGEKLVVHSDKCELPLRTCACVVGKLPVSTGQVNGHQVKVLKDSGCSTAAVKESLLEPDQYTGKYRDCSLIDGTVRRFPVARVHVYSEFYTGIVDALVMKKPVFDLIIGGDPSGELSCKYKVSAKSESDTNSSGESSKSIDESSQSTGISLVMW